MAQEPTVGQDLFIVEDSRSYSDAPHLVGLLQPDAETFTLKHTTLNRTQTSMPPAGFQPTIPASEWPQTHALDGAATGTGVPCSLHVINKEMCQEFSYPLAS